MCTPRSAFFRLTARSLGPTSRVLSERLTGKPEVNFPIADPPPTDCKFRKRPLCGDEAGAFEGSELVSSLIIWANRATYSKRV